MTRTIEARHRRKWRAETIRLEAVTRTISNFVAAGPGKENLAAAQDIQLLKDDTKHHPDVPVPQPTPKTNNDGPIKNLVDYEHNPDELPDDNERSVVPDPIPEHRIASTEALMHMMGGAGADPNIAP